VNARARLVLGVVAAGLLAVPLVAGRYELSVLILVFQFVLMGQAWNLMMGYAGQLSLGHALYVGLGAYVPALLWLHLGLSPLVGLFAGMAAAVAVAAAIGWLGFRFGIEGVYFALLTIAFAEVTRVGFDHFPLAGGAGGLFLPVAPAGQGAWWRLDGGPVFFYYVTLALAAGATGLVAALARSRLGYLWRAVRDDAQAAEALGVNLFRARMQAILVSAALASVAGVVNAFYYRNLFPSQVFDMGRSLELILAPIVGGLGSVFGPVVGAALLTPAGEGLAALVHGMGLDAPGTKAVAYGAMLIAVIWLRPSGIWPWLARRLGLA
jgi:branched-chain amino acid transport system permease protein